MFEIGGCEEVWSSIFWARRRGKREHQMKGCVAEQKVSDWQMNAWTLRPMTYIVLRRITTYDVRRRSLRRSLSIIRRTLHVTWTADSELARRSSHSVSQSGTVGPQLSQRHRLNVELPRTVFDWDVIVRHSELM